MRQLMEDEVQGDQEDDLHGGDGDADGDRFAPRHAPFRRRRDVEAGQDR
jgi:hypothetical protein